MPNKGLFFTSLAILCGCNYQVDKKTVPLVGDTLSFATVKEAVFDTRCVVCHDGTKSYHCGAYAEVKARLEKIRSRVFEKKDMPPDSPLSSAQYDLLSRWLAAGGPEFADNNPQKKPPEQEPPETVPKPLEPKFSSIHDKIFMPMCIHCHSPGKPGEKVPLNSREDLLNSPRLLVLPNTPDESGLLLAVKRKDKKRMPPPDSGFNPLSTSEVSVIYEWIKSGAPE